MTNTASHESLMDLIDAYAEARHRKGLSTYNVETQAARQAVEHALNMAPKAAPGEPFDECFPGEPRVAVPQGLISAACFAIRNKRDGGKVLEQLRRYSVGDLSQPLAPQQEAGAVPLTDEQIRAMLNKHPPEDVCGWSYRMGIDDAELHHGIKGGQHDTNT